MPVLPSPLDANVNNPSTFPSFSGGKKKNTGGKKKTTRKTRKTKTRTYKKLDNNKYCARICVSKRNISMGYTIDKQKLQ